MKKRCLMVGAGGMGAEHPESVFRKSQEEATRIMLHVHQTGIGVCGVYTYEVAETKVAQVMELARRNEHPLQCTMEKE